MDLSKFVELGVAGCISIAAIYALLRTNTLVLNHVSHSLDRLSDSIQKLAEHVERKL